VAKHQAVGMGKLELQAHVWDPMEGDFRGSSHHSAPCIKAMACRAGPFAMLTSGNPLEHLNRLNGGT